jgi:hypothetical protein
VFPDNSDNSDDNKHSGKQNEWKTAGKKHEGTAPKLTPVTMPPHPKKPQALLVTPTIPLSSVLLATLCPTAINPVSWTTFAP